MHQTLNRVLNTIIIFAMVLALCACNDKQEYLIKDYLVDLAFNTGLCLSKDIKESELALQEWGVLEVGEYSLQSPLKYKELSKTICMFLDIESDYLDNLKRLGYISSHRQNELVNKEDALKAIDKLVESINNKEFETRGYYKVLDPNGKTFTDIYKEFDIQGSEEIDFSKVEITPIKEDKMTGFINNEFQLLSFGDIKSFLSEGFNISYNFTSSGFYTRVTKKLKDNSELFFDLTLSNIKPSYKFKYKQGDITQTYLKLDYKAYESFGVSISDTGKTYIRGDYSNISNFIKDFKTTDDKIEATVKICEIKMPIEGVPLTSLNLLVSANIYASGKVEFDISNKRSLGFEIKNNKMRLIIDSNDPDYDFVISGNTKTYGGINLSLKSVEQKLMDLEIDIGLKGTVKSIFHLFDENGNTTSSENDADYNLATETFKKDQNIKVCGDLSFRWMVDLKANSSGTLLNKLGFYKSLELIDDNSQLFKELHHLENGMFVEKCTYKNRNNYSGSISSIDINRIVLDKYSIVLRKGQEYQITVVSIPGEYTKEDLRYEIESGEGIAINKDIINAASSGSSKVRISTSDGKYQAYLNVLVSYE